METGTAIIQQHEHRTALAKMALHKHTDMNKYHPSRHPVPWQCPVECTDHTRQRTQRN